MGRTMKTNLVDSNGGVTSISMAKPNQIPEADKKILALALSNYGHVIPPNGQKYTFLEFANFIVQNYSLDNPQNAEVVRVLRKWPPVYVNAMSLQEQRNYENAKKEGRICSNCQHLISKTRWIKLKDKPREKQLCSECGDAFRGVNVSWGYGHYRDEPRDPTGEE